MKEEIEDKWKEIKKIIVTTVKETVGERVKWKAEKWFNNETKQELGYWIIMQQNRQRQILAYADEVKLFCRKKNELVVLFKYFKEAATTQSFIISSTLVFRVWLLKWVFSIDENLCGLRE